MPRKPTEKMLLVAETTDPSDSAIECVYCCVRVTRRLAKEWIAAMDAVKALNKVKAIKRVGNLYGVELWRGAEWLVQDEDSGMAEKFAENFRKLEKETALLPGDPGDWGLVPAETRYDLQTVVVNEDELRFQCHYKGSGFEIEAFGFDRWLLEKAAKGL